MKTKLEMAHEFMMKKMETETIDNHWELFYTSWQYADAMQAEADQRKKEEAAQRRKEIREMLNAPNTFVEREGQHFDDVADACKTCGSSDEWQPDWSQAPDWANWWAMDMDKNCYWYEDKLHLGDVEWDRHSIGKSFKSKHYGYTGDWRNSLRKRPK